MAAKTDISQTSISAGQQLEFWRLASNPNSHVNAKTLQAFLEARNPFEKFVAPDDIKLTLTITPSTIDEMIVAGKYDKVNESVVKKFSFDPVTIGEWEFKLVSTDKPISPEVAKELCEGDGFQEAKLEHLLAFGAMFPEEQKKNPVIASASVGGIDGDPHVPLLWFREGERRLALRWWSSAWRNNDRFLSVRKVSSS